MDFHESWMEDGSLAQNRLHYLDNSFLCHSKMYNNITECDVQLDFQTEHDPVADSFCITAK